MTLFEQRVALVRSVRLLGQRQDLHIRARDLYDNQPQSPAHLFVAVALRRAGFLEEGQEEDARGLRQLLGDRGWTETPVGGPYVPDPGDLLFWVARRGRNLVEQVAVVVARPDAQGRVVLADYRAVRLRPLGLAPAAPTELAPISLGFYCYPPAAPVAPGPVVVPYDGANEGAQS